MQVHWSHRLYAPLALAFFGVSSAVLAAVDKLFGLVQHPLHLATVSYASLCLLIAWVSIRGIQLRPARLLRLSVYAGILCGTLLTAAYVFAYRVSADPTPLVLRAALDRGDLLLEEG